MSDSRALRVNTPVTLQLISWFNFQPLRSLLQYKDPKLRTAAEAGVDVAELALESLDLVKQQRLCERALEWVGLAEKDLPLELGIPCLAQTEEWE
ncbi:hypothetical protein BDV41DRAFT_579365 [Aspergillus transmontanensis]|uniref:Uncharacterized protein n=1 Tax=Aspergillus transmontanensis TaxID=1034304 RepID=A0A5N6VRX6_9EURO|nr:hypothetical protein BDV41DRAFT_579365 [Aspergillus transmontanensis]